ncbi:MAG: hypothetical protein RL021_544, partial [Bacteroidota bacterium]
TVTGTVTQPSGATYSGPVPAGGRIIGTPNLPVLPVFPAEITFPASGSTAITNNTTITPGNYGAMSLNGNKTINFNGPGVYVFQSIRNSGNANTFNFNFQNAGTGQFRIYVHGDVDLGKIVANLQNGGSAGRLYLETHGTGSASSNGTYSFMIANGSNGSSSKWLGTVYATRASICMGSGTGSTNFTGCLWSRGQVLVNSGVNSIYSPLVNCSSPSVNAGTDKVITCSVPTVQLNGSSTTTGVTYSWAASLGGVIQSGASTATPIVSAAGRYILTVTDASGNCSASDTAFVTANTASPNANAGSDKALTCTATSVTLVGSSTTAGVSYSWSAINGGVIVSGSATSSAVVNAAGAYVLTVTNPTNGCIARDTAIVTTNTVPPGANAGPDKVITCQMTTVTLNGTTLSGNTYSWAASGGGNIVSGANTLIPIVNAAGNYTLTVTNSANGCTSSDQAVVTINQVAPDAEAGENNALTCVITEVTLNGSSSLATATFQWATSGTGNIVSGANTAAPVVNGLGTYYLTVTDPANGCTATDSMVIEEGPCILPYYAPCPGGKYYGNLGCELGSLYDNYIAAGTDTIGQIFTVEDDSVQIGIITLSGFTQQLFNLVYQTQGYGMTDTIFNGANSLLVSGKFPIANLANLMVPPASNYINYVRPIYPALSNSGIALTQGDKAQASDLARSGFRVDGSGVKVCVISDSYNRVLGNNAQTDVLNGDLPGTGNPDGNTTPVSVLRDYPYGAASDEGRAMLQIVHDVAPGAELAFRTGFISEGDLATGIYELAGSGCKVIVDDVTFITAPFFQDGAVAKAVNNVTAAGVSYFTSAGNFGSKSYESSYSAMSPPLGLTGTAHDFGGGDNLLGVTLAPGTYTIVLQWEDSIYSLGQIQSGTQNDLDIYLTNQYGTKYFGFNRNNTGGDPIEVLPFVVPGSSPVQANLSVVRANGTQPVNFKLVVFRGELTFNEHTTGASTVVGHANAAGAITVGASNYFNTPAFGVSPPQVQNFSSRGGTRTGGGVRNKPDFTGPNGGNTTVSLGAPNVDGDLFPNFFGTSAAAPHAAGVAALLQSAKQKFYGTSFTPAQIRSVLSSTAIDIGAPGFDFASGTGLIEAFNALSTLAAPTPDLDSLSIPAGVTPGDTDFTVTVNGSFFNLQTVIIFNGDTLPTVYVN